MMTRLSAVVLSYCPQSLNPNSLSLLLTPPSIIYGIYAIQGLPVGKKKL